MSPLKKSTKKKPVWVKIKEHGESSPHLLNLHELTLDLRNEHQPDETDSFEEKIAALDERMREMPDLLKARADHASKLFKKQKIQWQNNFAAFMSRAFAFGNKAREQLRQVKRAHRRISRPAIKKYFLFPVLFKRLRAYDLGLMVILLFASTIPLQGFLVYRFINATQQDIKKDIAMIKTQANIVSEALLSRDITNVYSNLVIGVQALENLQNSISRFGPLIRFLPQPVKLGYNYLQSTQVMANDIITMFSYLAGMKDDKQILLIFQNPRELRATGGFAGSLALLTVRNGQIAAVDVPEGGSYDFQGQLALNRISPQPLHLINTRFELQDANWWPDFPRSARKITELYEAAGGPTLDAVVAITARVGEEILKLYGPLSTNEGEINAENFTDALQAIIARDRAADPSAPKRIITSLMPEMQKALTQTATKQPKQLLRLTTQLLEQKDIQVWSPNEETQAALKRLGWSGELRQTQGDYLAVITSNVAGGKTDGVVTESVDHETYITANDGVKHDLKAVARKTITIRRTHNGTKNDPTLGYRNVSYIRVYVPEQAQLISVSGNNPPPPYLFENPEESLTPDPDVRATEAILKQDAKSGTEIWSEDQKTIFGLWLMVDPGESSELTLIYDLPLKTYNDTIPYTLTIDPQSGKDIQFKGKITLDEHLKTLTGNQDGSWDIKGWKYEGPLKKTLVTSGVLYRL